MNRLNKTRLRLTSANVMKKLQVPYNNFVKEQARACRIKCYKYLDSSFNIYIIDNRFSFYCNNLDLLPKPKLPFEDLKKGIRISIGCLI